MATVSNGHNALDNSFDHLAPVIRDTGTPPPPPPKDDVVLRSPRPMSINAYFGSPRHSRTTSIYSLSKASFSHQLNQLTSLHLPDPATLSSTVAAIPTAPAATKALNNAGVQIRLWIQKAEEVLGGLDADDDIDWAAAGQEGVDNMDDTMAEFAKLMGIFAQSIEDLRKRRDIDKVSKAELDVTLDNAEQVIKMWEHSQHQLAAVKDQVHIAMIWVELWNEVLGGIGQEINSLKDMIFEMEEQRHQVQPEEESVIDSSVHFDIQELQTIVEETPNSTAGNSKPNDRSNLLSTPLNFPEEGSFRGRTLNAINESLIGLVARMQPLRTSIDFLPMRLESFRSRAEKDFPTACTELEHRRKELNEQYEELKQAADRLKDELFEDHYNTAFRGADRQVRKLAKTLELGIANLQEALESSSIMANPAHLTKKIESYESKKNHYAPSLLKVIEVIDSGVKQRRTINGEVLRIQGDAREMWERLQTQMKEIDIALDELSHHQHKGAANSQMRDSVSTILSNDTSFAENTVGTPGTSPASSIHMGLPRGKKGHASTPDVNGGSRASSIRSVSGTRMSTSTGKARTASNASNSKRLSTNNPMARLTSMSPSPSSRASSNTPTPGRAGASTPVSNKPRWNTSPVVKPGSGYFIKPVTASSPHSRTLNGKAVTPKPSVYSDWRSSPRAPSRNATPSTPNYTNSSPLARDASAPTSAHHPASFGARMAARAASNPNRASSRASYNTPPSVTRTPPSISTSNANKDKENSNGRPRSRLYKPSTPNLPVRVPAIGSASSNGSGQRKSLLPLPATQLHNAVTRDDINEMMCQGQQSPTFKATLARRPATSMASGRRSSLLPVPKE